jgi:release factor glutamine methyltransferase
MTVLEVIQRSAEFLQQKGVESPRLQIELMLAHALQVPRLKLYLNFDRALTEEELARLREMVRRRAAREPLQHILGTTSFCGLEIKCSRAALVPRPETELLAERAWKFLAGVASARALDFGTGTGCIAIAVAVNAPGAMVHAVDVSPDAIALAQENAQMNSAADRIHFHSGDGFNAVPGGLRFHLIVSNPPYIASREIETLQPEVREFDPRLALEGGVDGLDFYRRIALEALSFLEPTGKVTLEFGDGQAEAVKKIFENEKWIVEEIVPDYSARPRILIARLGG